MRKDFRAYLRYSKKHLDLAESLFERGQDADIYLIPAVILAWSAIESFVNNRCSDLNSLPEDMFETHERAFLSEKRLTFIDSGTNIGTFLLHGNEYKSLEDKIFFLMAKMGTRRATGLKGGTLWSRFNDFKKVRDGLVHPKQGGAPELTPDDVRKHILTSKELIEEISLRIWGKKIDI